MSKVRSKNLNNYAQHAMVTCEFFIAKYLIEDPGKIVTMERWKQVSNANPLYAACT